MVKSGKTKTKNKNSETPESQVEEPKAVAPVEVVGAGKNGTLLAACNCNFIKRARIEGKDSDAATRSRSIPTEIMFNILLLVADAWILRDIMRFVCKEWNAIISDPLFTSAHLCRCLSWWSSSHRLGFLAQDKVIHDDESNQVFYIHTNDDDDDDGDCNGYSYSWSKMKLTYKAQIMGSCNGLVLLVNAWNRKAVKELLVANLVTRAKTKLPSLIRAGVRILYTPCTTLAFAPSCGHHKVVYVSFVSNNKKQPEYVYAMRHIDQLCTKLQVKVMVCTIGVDKTWRAIDIDFDNIDCRGGGVTMSSEEVKRTLMSRPFNGSPSGYIYWFSKGHSHGLALDVDAETMYQFGGPKDDYFMNSPCNNNKVTVRTDTGTGVGLGVVHVKAWGMLWKLWELLEPKTGTWSSEATDIDVACMHSALRSHFNPRIYSWSYPLLFSLKRGELWVGSVVDAKYRLVCYNWKTGNIWSPPVIWPYDIDIPHLHINSLLSVKNNL